MAQTNAPSFTTSLAKELATFKAPPAKEVAPIPQPGSKAPSSAQLPFSDGVPTLIVFLRHCGCPFAEKVFKKLTAISTEYGTSLRCVAISHSSNAATEQWIPQVGGAWSVDVIVDEDRDLYAKWGLGVSTTWQVMSPWVLYSVFRLGQDEGIWNRPAESGSRWQKGGAFAVDSSGILQWSHVSGSADDLPDLDQGIKALGIPHDS